MDPQILLKVNKDIHNNIINKSNDFNNMRKWVLIALLVCCGTMSAQSVDEIRDSVKIYFRQSKIDLVPSLRGNQAALDRISNSLQTDYMDSVYRLRKVMVVGGASPEGSVKFNQWLSERRAGVLFDYLSRYGELPDSLKTTSFLGRDWNGLIEMVREDPDVPYKEETLVMLRIIADDVRKGDTSKGDPLTRIKHLRGGVPYAYMYKHLFPWLRASRMYLWYTRELNPAFIKPLPWPGPGLDVTPLRSDLDLLRPAMTYLPLPGPDKPFYMDIRTNMIYDALLLPNIGVEFYLGKNLSVMANWMYGWWKRDRSHWYWRAYGGDMALRWWFGKAARRKPLTGHHLGVYGQIFTYDFETGGRGYLGGKPGGTLWDKMNYAGGVEYGYSLPIGYRLNIDFTVGIGYWGGIYHEYIPVDTHYVWQATRHRHWFGPTKAEISLVWLVGHGNYNKGTSIN